MFQVIADLEEEKRRHAEDTAEGDDVTYILEKERERLQQQVCSTCDQDWICNKCVGPSLSSKVITNFKAAEWKSIRFSLYARHSLSL